MEQSMLKISPVIAEISQQGSPYFLIATVLHRKRPKTTFFQHSVHLFCGGTWYWDRLYIKLILQHWGIIGYIIILSCDFHVEIMAVTST